MNELFIYAKWKVLANFLQNPTKKFYVKELARKLKISSSTASLTLKEFAKKGILNKEVKGNLCFYTLNDTQLARQLKKLYFLFTVEEEKIVQKFLQIGDIISLAIYGSYAKGSYDEKSDIDFLVISSIPKEKFLPLIKEIEEKFGKEISCEVFDLAKWQRLAEDNKVFYDEVKANHILLYGGELI